MHETVRIVVKLNPNERVVSTDNLINVINLQHIQGWRDFANLLSTRMILRLFILLPK